MLFFHVIPTQPQQLLNKTIKNDLILFHTYIMSLRISLSLGIYYRHNHCIIYIRIYV